MTKSRIIRERCLLTYGKLESLRMTARIHNVSKSTVGNWVKQARDGYLPLSKKKIQKNSNIAKLITKFMLHQLSLLRQTHAIIEDIQNFLIKEKNINY